MPTEFEAKFLGVDPKAFAALMQAHGGTLTHPRRLMRRVVFHQHEATARVPGIYWRVRDEGNGLITMTFKNIHNENAIDGVHEVELKVDDFEAGLAFLKTAGLVQAAYQETWRTNWTFQETDIALDEWPGLRPFIEIEGPDESAVMRAATALGFDMSTAVFGAVDQVYTREMNLSADVINHLPLISFDHPPIRKISA